MKKFLVFMIFVLFLGLGAKEKDRIAVMDVQSKIFDEETRGNVTDYIFTRFQSTGLYWMIPKEDRDNAITQALEETLEATRKECVDEKCQLSMVAQLQANYLINTDIKRLYEGVCQISIRKFDVEKRAGVEAWENKFNCTEKGVYEAIDSFNFGGKKSVEDDKVSKKSNKEENSDANRISAVKFISEPLGALVKVDGRVVCEKTPCSMMIEKGKHEIVMEKEDFKRKVMVEEIKEESVINWVLEPVKVLKVEKEPQKEVKKLETEKREEIRPYKTASFILGGVGILSLGLGLYENSQKTDLNQKAKEAYAPENESKSDKYLEDAKTAGTLRNVFYGVGAASIATAAVLFFITEEVPVAFYADDKSFMLSYKFNF